MTPTHKCFSGTLRSLKDVGGWSLMVGCDSRLSFVLEECFQLSCKAWPIIPLPLLSNVNKLLVLLHLFENVTASTECWPTEAVTPRWPRYILVVAIWHQILICGLKKWSLLDTFRDLRVFSKYKHPWWIRDLGSGKLYKLKLVLLTSLPLWFTAKMSGVIISLWCRYFVASVVMMPWSLSWPLWRHTVIDILKS